MSNINIEFYKLDIFVLGFGGLRYESKTMGMPAAGRVASVLRSKYFWFNPVGAGFECG